MDYSLPGVSHSATDYDGVGEIKGKDGVNFRRKCSDLVAYGPDEIAIAIEWGAVEWLLVCGKPNKQQAAAVKRQGGKILSFFQNTNPIEFDLVSQFTGVCANLRFPLPDQDQHQAEEIITNMRMLSGQHDEDEEHEGVTVKPKRSNSASSSCEVAHASCDFTHVAQKISSVALPIDSILSAYLQYGDSSSSDSESEYSDHESLSEDALDEIESLQAIFPTTIDTDDDDDDDNDEQGDNDEQNAVVFHRVGQGKICLFVVTVNNSCNISTSKLGNGDGNSGSIAMRVMLPESYPEAPLDVVMEAHQGIAMSAAQHITTSAAALCHDLKGEPAMFSLALHLQDILEVTLKATN